QASGEGFAPGVYRATVVVQSQTAVPQVVNIPVMFVLGGSTSGTAITSIANSYALQSGAQTIASPGMLLSVLGFNLASTPQTASNAIGIPVPFSLGGVTATVNGLAAPILYVSPTQVNIQVPYEVGAGTAVLGINNNGQIAGIRLQIAPAAPGILSDATGNIVPTSSARQGGYGTIFFTGAGEVSPALKTAFAPSLA